MQTLRETLPDSFVNGDPMTLPEALRYYQCDGTIEGAVKCDDPMRNFPCYVDAEMMDGDNVGSTKICRENKFRTKPEWYVL